MWQRQHDSSFHREDGSNYIQYYCTLCLLYTVYYCVL
jgi:hypothetical protein